MYVTARTVLENTLVVESLIHPMVVGKNKPVTIFALANSVSDIWSGPVIRSTLFRTRRIYKQDLPNYWMAMPEAPINLRYKRRMKHIYYYATLS